jgi:aspartokinase
MHFLNRIELSGSDGNVIFRRKVIYPPTMIPAIESQIPIYIKNTFQPENVGTLIHQKSEVSKGLIKGIVSIEKTCLINITGNGMIGMKGSAEDCSMLWLDMKLMLF